MLSMLRFPRGMSRWAVTAAKQRSTLPTPVRVGHAWKSSVATSASRTQAVDEIFQMFEKHGRGDYVGEPISQEEHALQAADLAVRSGFGDEAVLAALLHDCGHLMGLDITSERMDDCGVANHEDIGGDWLKELGFSDKVSTLVRRHVDAKRYLCCVKPGYLESLSEASMTTLRFQGGPMTPEEAKQFEADELFKTIIAMRHWDEAAKIPDKEVPSLEAYRQLIARHVDKQLQRCHSSQS